MVDREDALDILKPTIGIYEKITVESDTIGKDFVEAFKMSVKALENQKTGHWETICPITSWQFTRDHYKCSECGTHWEYTFNYCPNCGAKMEGENNEQG